MARVRMNPGTKRARSKGVKNKIRNGPKPVSYAINKSKKPGPVFRDFNGNKIGWKIDNQYGFSLVLNSNAENALKEIFSGT